MATTILIIGGLMFVVSCYCVVASLADAPEGYEDESGFRYGPGYPRNRTPKPARVTVPLRSFEPAR